jgi:sulfide:quinone oxidoreductase
MSALSSEARADHAQVTLIDKSDAFLFGFAKLDVMFGRHTRGGAPAMRRFIKPGVRLRSRSSA